MFSKEYAMHQDTYVGTAPLYAAKTMAFFKTEPEDEIVIGQLSVIDIVMRRVNMAVAQSSSFARPRLSQLIYAASTFSLIDGNEG